MALRISLNIADNGDEKPKAHSFIKNTGIQSGPIVIFGFKRLVADVIFLSETSDSCGCPLYACVCT